MTVARSALAGIVMLALFIVPLAVDGQQARVYRVGVLLQGGSYSPAVDGLRDGLRELGLEEGKRLVLDVRDAKGDLKAVEAAARSLEAEKVDLIYSLTTSVTLAAKRATKRVPIVFFASTDPVALALSRPSESPAGDLRASTASLRTSRRSASSF